MNSYDIECLLIGGVLKYGQQAAHVVLPEITPDKFIFDMDGSFGHEHSVIWGAIMDVHIDQGVPSFVTVSIKLPEPYHSYLRSLIDRLDKKYFVYEYNHKELAEWARVVDKQGIVYNVSAHASQLSSYIKDTDMLSAKVRKIEDIDAWLNEQITAIRNSSQSKQNSGYVHIGAVVDKLIERWDRQYQGEQLDILPIGMPSIMKAQLFPRRSIAVVHGLRSSGKSAFVHQVNLGTGIGIVANKLKGCVAIHSLEMSQEELVERYAAALSGIDISRFKGGKKPITKQEKEYLEAWAHVVARLPIYIDDTDFQTTSGVEYKSTGLHVSERGPVLQLSSDYNELFQNTDGQNEEQRVNKIFREQFYLSRAIGASVIAISQSTTDKTSSRSYIAGPGATRYSTAIGQAADQECEMFNPEEWQKAGRTIANLPPNINDIHPWLLVQKNRKGAKGVVPLGWVAEYTRFFDLALNRGVRSGEEILFNHMEACLETLGMGLPVMPPDESAIMGVW